MRQNRSRRGYALLLSLTALLIGGMLGIALLSLATANIRQSIRRSSNALALNLAMGAMDQAVHYAKRDESYNGFSMRVLSGGMVEASSTMPAGQPDQRILVATATVSAGSYSVVKQIRSRLERAPVAPVFYQALAAKSSFKINGDVLINSGPTLHVGDVHCNQDVEIDGSAVTIDGDVTASGTVIMSGSPTITGTASSGVPPMVFPEVTQDFKNQSLANGTSLGTVTVSNGSTIQGKIVGDLFIREPNGARVNGVVWVTGRVTITGPVVGDGTIVADGKLLLDAKANYPAGDLSKLAFITTNTDPDDAVDLGGNRQFKGIIYAPYGGVNLHGTPALLGQIVANKVFFNGTPDITRLSTYETDPPILPRVFNVKGWEEL